MCCVYLGVLLYSEFTRWHLPNESTSRVETVISRFQVSCNHSSEQDCLCFGLGKENHTQTHLASLLLKACYPPSNTGFGQILLLLQLVFHLFHYQPENHEIQGPITSSIANKTWCCLLSSATVRANSRKTEAGSPNIHLKVIQHSRAFHQPLATVLLPKCPKMGSPRSTLDVELTHPVEPDFCHVWSS